MATIQIKTRDTQDVIFEYKAKNPTLKFAVEEAVKQDISLAFADLKGADLNGANIKGADLKGANLKEADLYGADLRYANLEGANLSNANLYGADIRCADLRRANLKGAYLRYADLSGANLQGADLNDANLAYANLSNAGFNGANLYDVGLYCAKDIPNDLMPLACPTDGSFIAWKKVTDKLIKLEIPADAKRSSATTHKCRCSKAKVLKITNLDEAETFDEVYNDKYATLTYRVGEMVYPDSFDENRWNECSHGIHFFMDKEDALNWTF